MARKPIVLTALSVMLLGACAGLPEKPVAPVLSTEVPLAGGTVPANGRWPDAQWWKQYRDPQLNALVALALKGAPSLASAQTRFNSALQSVRAASAASGARVDGNAAWARQRMSDSGLIPPQFLGFHWYTQADLGLQFTYDFDWWGKQRATVESVVDQVHAAEAENAAAALTLTSAVTETYFGWQADQARLKLARDIVDKQTQIRDINRLRIDSGIDSPDLLQQAESNLSVAREQVTVIEASAQLRIVALAALSGVSPKALPSLRSLPLPRVDHQMPANASIDLIARRPDIVASRWRVESAARNVDAARADFFPDISIKALAGFSAIDMDKLFRAGSRVFNLGPALHLPIFDAGLIKARYGISQAELDAAVATYNSTLVDAARDVATQSLTAQQIDLRRREHGLQVAAALTLRDSAAARERQGLTDARGTLVAQAQVLQQQDTLLGLDAQAIAANVALQKALGGGYVVVKNLPKQ